MIEKRGNAWCVVHGHPQKPGSKTDKPEGTPIKCYEFTPGDKGSEARAKSKAEKLHAAIIISGQADMSASPTLLQLQTDPALSLGLNSSSGLNRYRKELIKIGKYIKASTKQTINVTLDTLNHWVATYKQWTANGNKVPIPLGHDRAQEPEANQGWVTDMFVEGGSLYGIMELADAKLALTTDVSISIGDNTVVDGRGIKYSRPILHVALCTDPVVPGLGDFESMSFSLSLGESNMKDILKKIAAALKLSKEDPTEEDILAAIGEVDATKDKIDLSKIAVALKLSAEATEEEILSAIKPVEKVIEAMKPADKDKDKDKVELSTIAPAPQVVKLVTENREIKLGNLVKAGIITPAVKDVLATRFVAEKAVTLELSKGNSDEFDFLYGVLAQNNPVKLAEITGVQVVELSQANKEEPENPVQKDINRRRKEAGIKD